MFELVKREFAGRYRGSFGGVAWSFAQPLFLLTIYTIAFGVILKMRWGFSGDTSDYALMLFGGLIIFNAFSECLIKAPTLITANPNFVKKVVFPLEILPWVMALTALVHALLGVAVWFVGYAFVHGMPQITALFFPLVLLCFFPILLGVGWMFAAVGVIVRDLSQLTGMFSQTVLFLTPIFYGMDTVSGTLRNLLMLNPLTFVVEQFRQVLFIGGMPDLPRLAVYFLLSSCFAWTALILFRRLRSSFADML